MTDEPTQAEIDALSRALEELANREIIPPTYVAGELARRANLMIARLERLWLEARKS